MKMFLIIGAALGALFLAFVVILGVIFVKYSNAESAQRNLIVAKQVSNKADFDNMWKKNMESFDITQAQKDAVYQIVVGNAHERAAQGKGSLAAMVTEAVPNVDTSIFTHLMNVVTSGRNEWTARQKELADLNRVHDNMIDLFPSSLICSTILGRQKIVIQIVTSDRSENAFATGKDNDVGFGSHATKPVLPAATK